MREEYKRVQAERDSALRRNMEWWVSRMERLIVEYQEKSMVELAEE